MKSKKSILVLVLIFGANVLFGADFLSGMDETTKYADQMGKGWLGIGLNWFLCVVLPSLLVAGLPMLVAKFGKKHIMSGNEDEKWKLYFAYAGAMALGIIVYLFGLYFIAEGLFGGGDKGITLLQTFWKGVAGI